MRECRQAGPHGGQSGASTRPRQLRSREIPWEGSYGSKRMSRRTERPYQVDGTGDLARHSAAPCSVPEINTESNEPGTPGRPHRSGRAELGRQNTTIGGLVPGALKPIGRALGSDPRGRERVTALSVRTARNRRTRTRMSGGVGGGGKNPPADPIKLRIHQ